MAGILKRVIRIRKLRERVAKLELQQLENNRRAQEALIGALADRVVESNENIQGALAEDVIRHHAFALRSEMQRRRETAVLARHVQRVEGQRQGVVSLARSRKTAETANEIREKVEQAEADQKDQKRLDEVGIQGWWRKQVPG